MSLRRDQRGAAVVEMALALPILILMLYGIFVCGMLFMANASLQNGLGQGARYATLWNTPDDDKIIDKIKASYFSNSFGNFPEPTISGTSAYKLITVSYTITPDLLFMTLDPITIVHSKRVNTSNPTASS